MIPIINYTLPNHLKQLAAQALDQWNSTFSVQVPTDVISLQRSSPKVVGV
jgi:hypothetical protein